MKKGDSKQFKQFSYLYQMCAEKSVHICQVKRNQFERARTQTQTEREREARSVPGDRDHVDRPNIIYLNGFG